MNQSQRMFLVGQIEALYKKEKAALDAREPQPPSLNNYLIAAILDGTAVLRSAESIRDVLRERVRDLGKSEALLSSVSWRNRKQNDGVIEVPALVLYEPPPEYSKKLAAYEEALALWEAEERALEASISAMKIKIQVGSDAALASLVDQADKICSMSLSASNLLIASSSQPRLPDKK